MPTSHTLHCDFPDLSMYSSFAATQTVHFARTTPPRRSSLDSEDTCPCLHHLQPEVDGKFWYLPLGHCLHGSPSSPSGSWAASGSWSGSPMTEEYLPTLQDMHCGDPAPEYFPDGHASVQALVVSDLVDPYRPGAHRQHASLPAAEYLSNNQTKQPTKLIHRTTLPNTTTMECVNECMEALHRWYFPAAQ